MNLRNLLAAGTVGLLSLNLISCGTEEDAAATSSSLTGSWQSDCLSEEEDGQTKYYKEMYVFTTTVFTIESQEFSDSSCATEASSYALSGTITVGEELTSPSGATELDITIAEVASLTIFEDNQLEYFNTQSICGGGWVKGAAKNVSSVDCTDDIGKSFTSMLGKTMYTIYKIEDNTLSIGLEAGTQDGSTEAKRETSFDTNTLTKQASNT